MMIGGIRTNKEETDLIDRGRETIRQGYLQTQSLQSMKQRDDKGSIRGQ